MLIWFWGCRKGLIKFATNPQNNIIVSGRKMKRMQAEAAKGGASVGSSQSAGDGDGEGDVGDSEMPATVAVEGSVEISE